MLANHSVQNILFYCLLSKKLKVWSGCIWLRTGAMADSFEPLGSIKGGEFHD